jgi:hypothetical protein
MNNRFLISVAAVALLAGTNLVNAQGTGGNAGGANGGGAMQNSPTGERGGAGSAGGSAGQMNRDAAPSKGGDTGLKSSQSDEKIAPGSKSQRAQESTPGQKSNGMSSDNSKAGKDKEMKAEDRGNNRNAESNRNEHNEDSNRNAESNRNAGSNRNAESKSGDSRSSTTTGQAGAGAKLSSEQRTKFTTVIKEQRIQPATNVNFSISVGTRVPRTVGFHPLPAEIVTEYPDWRGYEFFLVRDEIIVVNPRTLEIVAVLDA